jgi:hypothetical protein
LQRRMMSVRKIWGQREGDEKKKKKMKEKKKNG